MNMPLTGSVMEAAKALADYSDTMGERRECIVMEAEDYRLYLANRCATALSSASQIEPTSPSRPFGLQSTFAREN